MNHSPIASPRTRVNPSLLCPIAIALVAWGSSLLHAEAGDGTWLSTRTSTRFWEDGANWQGSAVAGGTNATVLFNANASATITANITNGPQTVGNVTVRGVSGSGNAIAIAGNNTFTLQTDFLDSRPTFDIQGTADQGLSIGSTANLSGTQGFEKKGNGRLSINGATAITGDIILTQGSINLGNVGALNGNKMVVNGEGTELRLGYTGDYTSHIELLGGNALITGASTDRTLSGVISQSGATARGVTYLNSAGGTTNVAGFLVTGANSYQGDTVIGGSTASRTVVQIYHHQGLGTGVSNVIITGSAGNDRNALELLGGITISDKTLTLNGKGYEGSLVSRTGNNRWAGDVKLGTTADPTITVASLTELIVDGVVSGDAAGGLHKRGGGTLLLNGENTYATGTVVQSGILAAGHDQAVGYQAGVATSGNIVLEGTSRLRITENVNLQVRDLSLTGSHRFIFDLDALPTEALLAIRGDLTGDATYFIDISTLNQLASGNYLLMEAENYSSFTGSFSLGSGLPTDLAGSTLSWSEGRLVFHAIPEAQHWALLGAGALVLGVAARRKRHFLNA